MIHVKARAGNQSPVYKIIPFVRQYDAQTVAQSTIDGHDDAQTVAQSVAQSDHIPRYKDIKTKDNRVYDDVGYKEVLNAYRKNIYPMPGEMDLEKLKGLIDDFGSNAVIKAIDRAVARNKRSLAYIRGILNNWRADGYDEEGTKAKEKDPLADQYKKIPF